LSSGIKVLVLLWLARKRGAVLVWTGHNLTPHEANRLWLGPAFHWLFLRQVDGVISLSESGSSALRQRHARFGAVPLRTIRHGHYRDAYPVFDGGASDARGELSLPLDGTVYLALGRVRPYKRLHALVGQFIAWREEDEFLVIAGQGEDKDLSAVREAALGHDSVVLHGEPIGQERVTAYLAACDVMVLPYGEGSALNSGAAFLALSFDCPVAMRDSPTNRELRKVAGEEWVYLGGESVESILGEARRATKVTRSSQPLDQREFDWPVIASETLETYQEVMQERRARRGFLNRMAWSGNAQKRRFRGERR